MIRSMHCPDPLPALLAASRAMRKAASPEASIPALQQAPFTAFGLRLFTIMAHNAARGWNRHVISSVPDAWPISGKLGAGRPKRRMYCTRAGPGRAVAKRGCRVYPDHARALTAGLNLLDAEGRYSTA